MFAVPPGDGTTRDAPTSTPEVEGRDSYAEIAHELGRQGRLLHLFKGHMSNWAPAGLDWAAFGLLMSLIKCGASRQGDLADVTLLDPSTVSRHTAQLVKAGLVSRRPDPADGRAVQLVATESGLLAGQDLLARRQALLRGILADWSDDDAQTFLLLTRRLNDGLERRLTEGSHSGRGDVGRPPRLDVAGSEPPGHAPVTRHSPHQNTQES